MEMEFGDNFHSCRQSLTEEKDHPRNRASLTLWAQGRESHHQWRCRVVIEFNPKERQICMASSRSQRNVESSAIYPHEVDVMLNSAPNVQVNRPNEAVKPPKRNVTWIPD